MTAELFYSILWIIDAFYCMQMNSRKLALCLLHYAQETLTKPKIQTANGSCAAKNVNNSNMLMSFYVCK